MRNRKRMTHPISQKMLWKRIKSDGSMAKFKSENRKSSKEKLKPGRYVLLASKDKKGGLRVYKSISINDERGKKMLKGLAD
jgi:hypothetical protein